MKLLVVSHPCVTPSNQAFFAELERQTGWALTLVGPATWRSEYGMTPALRRGAGFRGQLAPVPVWGAGNIPLHTYRTVFAGLLRAAAPDVVYVHHEPYAVATAQIYLANWLTIRRPIGFFTWQNIPKRYPPPFRHLERMVYRQSAFALTGSEEATAVLRSKRYEGPAVVLPAGIDAARYAPSIESEQLRADLCRTEDEALIGFVGRIAEEKGLITLVRALKHIEDLRWRLVIVGTGPQEAHLDAQLRAIGLEERVLRTGYVSHDEAPKYLAAFDILAVPSETRPNWKEQFGRVIIEAMASGTPVVGSDSGEIPHLIRRTGGGVVFPEGEAAACAAALRTLLEDPARRYRLGAEGRGRVRARYTHASLARRFADVVSTAVLSS